jgi:hypothetical protein
MNKALAATLIAAAGLTACSSDAAKEARAARERNPAPCPNIVVLNDAARLVEFVGDAALENVAWSAEIMDVSLSCRYFTDRPIEAKVDLKIAFGRGPAAEATAKEFSYFVAVTRTDQEVIAKENFTVPVQFKDGRDVALIEQKIEELIIPRKAETTSGTNFEIVVGMVLTREQALYNRSGKSLKFPDLK